MKTVTKNKIQTKNVLIHLALLLLFTFIWTAHLYSFVY